MHESQKLKQMPLYWDAEFVFERRYGKSKDIFKLVVFIAYVLTCGQKIKRYNLANVIFTLCGCQQRNMLLKCGRVMIRLLCSELRKCSWLHYCFERKITCAVAHMIRDTCIVSVWQALTWQKKKIVVVIIFNSYGQIVFFSLTSIMLLTKLWSFPM